MIGLVSFQNVSVFTVFVMLRLDMVCQGRERECAKVLVLLREFSVG